jgi:spoIIIJ-associated protein
MKVYPVGKLRRFAEQKAQEVLMKGESEILPPMGSFERFVIHDYLKNRDGVRTESFGEGKDRHVEIFPLFGRNPKKVKRKLTR